MTETAIPRVIVTTSHPPKSMTVTAITPMLMRMMMMNSSLIAFVP